MKRTQRATWIVVTGVVALLVAASVDALRSTDAPSPELDRADANEETLAPEELVVAPPEPAVLITEPCLPVHTRLEAERVEGRALGLTLINTGTTPCRTRRVGVHVSLLDAAGRRVRSAGPRFGGTFPSTELWQGAGVTTSYPYTYVYLCTGRTPVAAVVEAGPYATRTRLAQQRCLEDFGP